MGVKKKPWKWMVVGAWGLGATLPAPAVEYALHGYVREYIAVNLEDKPEPNHHGEEIGGQWGLAMARSVVKLDADVRSAGWYAKVVGRFSREHRSPYLEELEDTARFNTTLIGSDAGRFVYDEYDEESLREAYVGFDLGPYTHVILGKQQVAWGEADFFRATDVVHGYDLRWRSNLERENEETRSPLWMANVTFNIPAWEAQVQLLYRPGWDRAQDVITQRDLFGGRFAGAGYRGVNSLSTAPYNWDNPAGDTDDANYGIRWSHHLFDHAIDYSLLYYRGLEREPIINSAAIDFSTFPFTVATPVGALPANTISDTIFPKIDTFGVTFTSDLAAWDTVLRGEIAYVPNQPYNIGTRFMLFGAVPVPGLGGIVEKATLRPMIGFDKTVRWTERLLKTQRPGIVTMEVFDRWILNYDRDDDIVEVFAYGAAAREHQPILSTTLSLNYDYDQINPSVALLYDLNFGDAVLIPAVEYVAGNHWRFYLEASLYLPAHGVKQSAFEVENDTHLLGTGGNNSQLMLRTTYQF
jgi:hypothetical protein